MPASGWVEAQAFFFGWLERSSATSYIGKNSIMMQISKELLDPGEATKDNQSTPLRGSA